MNRILAMLIVIWTLDNKTVSYWLAGSEIAYVLESLPFWPDPKPVDYGKKLIQTLEYLGYLEKWCDCGKCDSWAVTDKLREAVKNLSVIKEPPIALAVIEET